MIKSYSEGNTFVSWCIYLPDSLRVPKMHINKLSSFYLFIYFAFFILNQYHLIFSSHFPDNRLIETIVFIRILANQR